MTRTAIILAAGYGSRLQALSASKPLARLGAMSLIAIAVRQAAAAGLRRVIVVTGHEAEAVEAELAMLDAELGCEVRAVRIDDWSRPNGWSVIAGAEVVDGPFLLLMADHLFADGLLCRLASQQLAQCDVILATDRPDNPLVDPGDATWVALDDAHKIVRIGKTIAPYDAVDCGAFLADASLPAAIRTAIAEGKAGSLSDGMQVLADRGRALALDIEGAWWIDVDDPRAHALAEAEAGRHIATLAREAENA
ncbi:NTP transferase domain-containing protein [Qipengyuania nanhaisediminis]|uniref:NTP transferase domain-containing protein n=1 Tax=Qipengyuania nanhaisediminis TaxID=604088 RepID=UPI0038B37686